MLKPTARHSKEEVRWGTPADIVERARRVMGSIDLDPCSSISFNSIVKATEFYSLDDFGQDGLKLPWKGNVFLNPPGGSVKEFWRKSFELDVTCNKWPQTSWNKLFWVGFSVEQLALLADERHHPMDHEFCFCILRKRIRFTRHDGYSGSPSHANYVTAIGVDPADFAREFRDLGRVYCDGKRK